MNETALREALHDVASVGAGTVSDARLAGVVDRAKGGEQVLTASHGGGRRRWVVGGLAVAAVGVLVVLGMAHALRPVEVTPASGPGSLPYQIFPTRQHILTLEQAPIGRVSMVYAGAWANGGPAWIAVGADTDEYRWVAPASDHLAYNANLDVSPDGSTIAIGRGGDGSGDLRLDLLDVFSGTTSSVPLPDDGAGGRIESLRWDFTGDEVVVQASVTNGDDPDRSSGQVRLFKVVVSDRSVDVIRSPASWSDLPVGWGRDGWPLMGNDEGQGQARRFVVSTTDTRLPSELGRVSVTKDGEAGFSLWSVSPDNRLLAALPSNGDGQSEAGRLMVWRLSDGKLVGRLPLGPVVTDSAQVIGWKDAKTPVYSYLTDSRNDVWGHVQSVSLDGRVNELFAVPGDNGDSVYRTSRLAADVLAAGQFRTAEPPHQPWYDPRTLGPTLREWISEHPYSLFLLLITAAASAALGTLQLSRRRRVARSQSGS